MEPNIFRTTDIPTVTVLTHLTFSQDKPAEVIDRITYFTFTRTPELERALTTYLNREVRVEPMGLLETFRRIKTELWEARKHAGVMGGRSNE